MEGKQTWAQLTSCCMLTLCITRAGQLRELPMKRGECDEKSTSDFHKVTCACHFTANKIYHETHLLKHISASRLCTGNAPQSAHGGGTNFHQGTKYEQTHLQTLFSDVCCSRLHAIALRAQLRAVRHWRAVAVAATVDATNQATCKCTQAEHNRVVDVGDGH